MGLPVRFGSPIFISFRPALTAWRGRLLSGSQSGREVYAASFIRERRIVLHTDLKGDQDRLRFFLAHELFHFVWASAGNPTRSSYNALLKAEFQARARGEMGESSGVAKLKLLQNRNKTSALLWRGLLWREYVCESFCDTGAVLFAGKYPVGDCTLASRWRRIREQWFDTTIHWESRCF
jgi:hypothetical protein